MASLPNRRDTPPENASPFFLYSRARRLSAHLRAATTGFGPHLHCAPPFPIRVQFSPTPSDVHIFFFTDPRRVELQLAGCLELAQITFVVFHRHLCQFFLLVLSIRRAVLKQTVRRLRLAVSAD